MYYNTNQEVGDKLHASWAQTAKQDELIYSIFVSDSLAFHVNNAGLTPDEVHEITGSNYYKEWPITSIRRAINTLTKDGKLAKTDELRTGGHGKKTHVWKLNTESDNN
jgi:hypothetical protein|tara:strand:+ start:3608 stop:3931 length:324 start_codon:yes stop_codon:yes gene_type:complete